MSNLKVQENDQVHPREGSLLSSFPVQNVCIGVPVFEHKGEGILH